MTEFGLIEHIRRLCGLQPPGDFEGIGDDCAVLPVGGGESLVFTTDLLCEGVHFLRHATTARELGGKALAVNLSDVASMGATPVATLLSLSLPPDATGPWAEEFAAGYCDASARWGTALVGGDTTASASGITVSVTAIGRAADAHIKRRSAACAGDVILTAGRLGASAAGLRDLLAGRLDTPLAAIHRNPVPQTAEGAWLGTRPEVHAMVDLSDGLASDIRRIMEQSHTGAEIDLERIPTDDGADLRTALCGGEDYKLLLTAAPHGAETLCADFLAHFGTPLYPVGRITPSQEGQSGPVWLLRGERQRLRFEGFEHF